MNIEVQLPDGSIAEFPQGTPPEVMQAEIEKVIGSPANPSRNPDPTERGSPRPNVPTRLEQGQRGGGNSAMPIPQSMSALPQAPAPDQAPVVPGAGQPQQGPRTLIERMTPEQRKAFAALPPEEQELVLADASGTGSPSTPRETTTDQLRQVEGEGKYAPMIAPVEGPYMSPSQAQDRYIAWESGRPGDYTGPRPTRAGSPEDQVSDEARASAEEARRLREEQGITSARGSMGDNITQGNNEAAALQADEARAAVTPQGQEPRARPEVAAEETNEQRLQFPNTMSVQEAARNDPGNTPIEFSMGDGKRVAVRTAPKKAVESGVKTGMDFLMQRSEAIIVEMLKTGDIVGATQFRDFIRGEQTQNGLRDMNTAMVAASYGDSSAFTTAINGMVKSMDPDGEWQIDTEGTGLTIQDGQATGATLSLRNKRTGEVMTNEYDGMQQVVSALSDWGSPTAAFERQQERVAGAMSQKIAKAEDYATAYNDAMEAMFDKDSFVDMQGNAISQEEMARRDEIVRNRIQSVRPDLAPPQMQGGAASGVGATGFTGGSNGQPVPTFGQ